MPPIKNVTVPSSLQEHVKYNIFQQTSEDLLPFWSEARNCTPANTHSAHLTLLRTEYVLKRPIIGMVERQRVQLWFPTCKVGVIKRYTNAPWCQQFGIEPKMTFYCCMRLNALDAFVAGMVPSAGLKPTTASFVAKCSFDWATRACGPANDSRNHLSAVTRQYSSRWTMTGNPCAEAHFYKEKCSIFTLPITASV